MKNAMATGKPRGRSGQPGPALDKHLGHRLGTRRRELGLTASALDKTLSARPGTVSRFEAGLRSMGAVDLFALSRALKVDILYFFEDAPALQSCTNAAPGVEFIEEAERFIDAYYKIPDAKVRRDILNLLKATGEQ